jgi:hypothetical protein
VLLVALLLRNALVQRLITECRRGALYEAGAFVSMAEVLCGTDIQALAIVPQDFKWVVLRCFDAFVNAHATVDS